MWVVFVFHGLWVVSVVSGHRLWVVNSLFVGIVVQVLLVVLAGVMLVLEVRLLPDDVLQVPRELVRNVSQELLQVFSLLRLEGSLRRVLDR